MSSYSIDSNAVLTLTIPQQVMQLGDKYFVGLFIPNTQAVFSISSTLSFYNPGLGSNFYMMAAEDKKAIGVRIFLVFVFLVPVLIWPYTAFFRKQTIPK